MRNLEEKIIVDNMYQAYIPGRGPYPALFPVPLAHPSPLRPGEGILPSAGPIGSASGHSGAPILSIPSMAAFRAKMEKDSSGCLNLVKKDTMEQNPSQGGQPGSSPSKSQSQLQPPAANRPAGSAEFTRFTIDEILGKNEGALVKEDQSDEELSGDEIEVVRCNTPDSESEKTRHVECDDGDLVFGSANVTAEVGADDPSARFSWLQCTRYKPPKLPRKCDLCYFGHFHRDT